MLDNNSCQITTSPPDIICQTTMGLPALTPLATIYCGTNIHNKWPWFSILQSSIQHFIDCYNLRVVVTPCPRHVSVNRIMLQL